MKFVFLVGMMGAGKTAVGRVLSERLSLPFVDLDEEIVREAAGTKSEKVKTRFLSVGEIFAREGEAGFRARERAALDRVLSGPPAVVATGGGIVENPGAMERMKEAGTVVFLDVSAEEALQRIGPEGRAARPLLSGADPEAAWRERAARRRAAYGEAHFTVATDGRTPAEVAEAIARGIAS